MKTYELDRLNYYLNKLMLCKIKSNQIDLTKKEPNTKIKIFMSLDCTKQSNLTKYIYVEISEQKF